jgi:hypothetical protein
MLFGLCFEKVIAVIFDCLSPLDLCTATVERAVDKHKEFRSTA